MLLVRAALLWALIILQVIGGAFLFRRLLPRESPWLGFVVPEILFVLFCNMVEHHVALTFLSWLLPAALFGSLWVIIYNRTLWRVMRLPSFLFATVFLVTIAQRMMAPDIAGVRDGVGDMALMSSFCLDQTLPTTAFWLPPFQLIYYYTLPHYAASLLLRLCGLDPGTAFNMSAAFLSAYIYFFTGAIAWQLSRGKLWITVLSVFLTFCGTTGATGYVWLLFKDMTPEEGSNLFSRLDVPEIQHSLLGHLQPIAWSYDQHELMPPGYWSWMGALHSATAGLMLILLSVYALTQALRRKSTNWSWICLFLVPLLMLTSCTWGVPISGIYLVSALVCAWRMRLAPLDWRLVAVVVGTCTFCLSYMLAYFLSWQPPGITWNTQYHTQVVEFLILWWPIYLPWLALIFFWRRLPMAVRIVHLTTPVALIAVEMLNVGQRYDTTCKMWGMIFGAAWVTFIPILCTRQNYIYRVLLIPIIVASLLSLAFWCSYTRGRVDMRDWGHLEGRGAFLYDDRKARILSALTRLHHQIIISGTSSWSYCVSPFLGQFTLNPIFVTNSVLSDDDFSTNGHGEGYRREKNVNAIYDGTNQHPLFYLRQNDIAALVIYPDDNIKDEVIDNLIKELAPYYTYEDYRDGDPPQGSPNAGVFLYHPEVTKLVGPPRIDPSMLKDLGSPPIEKKP